VPVVTDTSLMPPSPETQARLPSEVKTMLVTGPESETFTCPTTRCLEVSIFQIRPE
jgi:hypothetical protein